MYSTMNYKSFNSLNRDIAKWLQKIPDRFDIIVGIPRSGLLVANIIALHFNLPLTDVENLREGFLIGGGTRCSTRFISILKQNRAKKLRIFVVDDTVDKGRQLDKAKKLIASVQHLYEVYYGALYVTPGQERLVDFYYESIPKPRAFEWNVLHCSNLSRFCVDIECLWKLDTHLDETDFSRIKPTMIPTREIGHLIVCHPERHRTSITNWLKNNKIYYRNLVTMSDTWQSNLCENSLSVFKAGVYILSGSKLFIEKSRNQALEISRITEKEVLCWNTRKLVGGVTPL